MPDALQSLRSFSAPRQILYSYFALDAALSASLYLTHSVGWTASMTAPSPGLLPLTWGGRFTTLNLA
jgi:hypothetical protein